MKLTIRLIAAYGPPCLLEVSSLEDASRQYCALRDKLNFGASALKEEPKIWADKKTAIARISYNGRVWPMAPWHEGMKPLCEAQY